MLVALLILTALPTAVPHECGASWAESPQPEPNLTERCAEAWLETTYGPDLTIEDLTLDAPLGTGELTTFTSAQLRRMASHVKTTFPSYDIADCAEDDRPCHVAGRAIELFLGEANLRHSVYDPVRMQSIMSMLSTVIAGKALSTAKLQPKDGRPWTPLTLWKLRNAVFARHGRKFSNADLNQLFYGSHEKPPELPKLTVDASYTDARLTSVDRANIQRIRRAERR